MIHLITKKIRSFIVKRRRLKVEQDVKSITNLEFSIISSNCIGSKIYQILNLPYNTPTVGLFFYAPCYIKFITRLTEYIEMKLEFAEHSRYPEANVSRATNGNYPLGRLGDIEIHFYHYENEKKAVSAWTALCKRINHDRLFFIFTDKDNCTPSLIQTFDNLPHKNKVCFVAKEYKLKSCIHIPYYNGKDCIGDLHGNYENFYRNFSFSRWLDG